MGGEGHWLIPSASVVPLSFGFNFKVFAKDGDHVDHSVYGKGLSLVVPEYWIASAAVSGRFSRGHREKLQGKVSLFLSFSLSLFLSFFLSLSLSFSLCEFG